MKRQTQRKYKRNREFSSCLSDPEFLSACRKFSENELINLKSLFFSLASQSRSHGQYIIASVFQVLHLGMLSWLNVGQISKREQSQQLPTCKGHSLVSSLAGL